MPGRAGARLELPFWPAQVARYRIAEPVTHGELLVWDPPRVFELIWEPDRLRWELTPEGEGTALEFTTWLGDGSPEGLANSGAGYHVCLDRLAELLDTGSVGLLEDGRVRELEGRYARLPVTSDRSA